MEKIEFEKRRDIGQLLSVTFNFLQQEYKVFFKYLLLVAIPLSLLYSVGATFYFTGIFNNIGEIETLLENNLSMFFIAYAVLIILVILYSFFLILYTSAYMKCYKENKGEVEKDVLINTAKSIAGRLILIMLAVSAVYISLSLLLIGINVLLFAMDLPAALIVTAPASFVVIIYVLLSLYLAIPVSIFEAGIIESIKRSFKLIKGYWWFTLGAVIVMVILSALIQYVFLMPMYIYMIVSFISGGISDPMNMTANLNPIITFVFNIFSGLGMMSSVIPLILMVFHYFNLITRKENPELMNRIDQLGNPTTEY